MARYWILAVLTGAGMLCVAGCGGGGGSFDGAGGTDGIGPTEPVEEPAFSMLEIVIAWPEVDSRFIPPATTQLKVTALVGGTTNQYTFARSSGTQETHTVKIPAGQATITAEAVNAAGTVLSQTTIQADLLPGQTSSVSLDLVATSAARPNVTAISVSPSVPIVGDTVTYRATADSPNGGALTFSWEFQGGVPGTPPVGGEVSARDESSPVTRKYDAVGPASATVTATDSYGQTGTRTVSMTVGANQPPTAAFTYTPDPASEAVLTTLDGSTSSDPEGRTLTYAWRLISRPAGATAGIMNSISAQATLTPDLAGDWLIGLTVNDGYQTSAEVQHTVTAAANAAPIAAITVTPPGAGQYTNLEWTLSGATSSDPDGTAIDQYEWELAARPAATTASDNLEATTGPTVAFWPLRRQVERMGRAGPGPVRVSGARRLLHSHFQRV